MRAFGGFLRHLGDHDAALFLGGFVLGHIRLEALGAGEPQLEAEYCGGLEPGVGHVVAVANPGDALPFPAAEVLLNREDVGQHLAGVGQIGQAVDHGDRGEAGQLLDLGVAVGADHDPVDIAGQHPGGVRNRLTPPDLDVLAGEEEGLAAQLVGPDLEGDAGAGGRLGEDHRQRLAGEGGLPILPPLHPLGQIEELLDLLAAEVGDLQEVALGQVLTPGPSVKMTGYDDRRILPGGGGKDKAVVPSYLVRTTLILGDSLLFCSSSRRPADRSRNRRLRLNVQMGTPSRTSDPASGNDENCRQP